MIVCLSHANNIEWCEIDNDYYHLLTRALEKDFVVEYKNYDSIGGFVESSSQELKGRLRFYESYDRYALDKFSVDKTVLYDLLDALDAFLDI